MGLCPRTIYGAAMTSSIAWAVCRLLHVRDVCPVLTQRMMLSGFRFTFDMQDTYSAPTIGVAHALNWGHQDQVAIALGACCAMSGTYSAYAAIPACHSRSLPLGSQRPSCAGRCYLEHACRLVGFDLVSYPPAYLLPDLPTFALRDRPY
eukprot:2440258-Rhodomonas_salina.5